MAVVVLVALVVAFAAVYHSSGSQLRAQIDSSLRDNANQLEHAIVLAHQSAATQAHHPGDHDDHDDHPGAQGDSGGQDARTPPPQHAGHAGRTVKPASLLSTARSYAAQQPYASSAVLLFVIVPGVGTASNHPDLFNTSDKDENESAAVKRAEDREAARLAVPRVGFSTQMAPDVGRLRTYEIRFTVGKQVAYAGAGEQLTTVDRAQSSVSHSFLLAGVLALAAAMLAAYLVGTRIVSPIRRSAAVAARIDGGDLTPRIHLPAGSSSELLVMAEAINHMLDRLAAAFAAQREFVADASHELRTPLTVLRGQLDVLAGGDREDGGLSAQELARVEPLMQAEIARLARLVDDLLVLAQSDRDDFLHVEDVALDELATELWDGLSLTARRDFALGQLDPVSVRADPDRLAQALRNLARNAIAHTQAPDGLVRVDVVRHGGTEAERVRITVSDDGPGVPPELRERVFERFYRLDGARTRASGGAGLGLAIVRAIAEAHGGSVRVTDAASGGAAFELDLPLPGRLSV